MGAVADFLKWLMSEVGYAVCHQLPDRCLQYGGRALPVCARDTGFFLGFTACFLILLAVYGRRGNRYPSWKVTALLAVMILPAVVDGITSYAGLRETTNAVRLSTGGFAGTAVAALIFPLAVEQVFRDPEERVVLERWWSPLLLVLIPVGLSLVLWPDWRGGFWVWGALACLSLLFTLFVLNATLISLLVARAGRKDRGLSPGALAGLALLAAACGIAAANRLHWLVDRVL